MYTCLCIDTARPIVCADLGTRQLGCVESVLVICSGTFFKATADPELVTLEGKHRARLLGASGHTVFTIGSILNLLLCVFLSKDTLLISLS